LSKNVINLRGLIAQVVAHWRSFKGIQIKVYSLMPMPI